MCLRTSSKHSLRTDLSDHLTLNTFLSSGQAFASILELRQSVVSRHPARAAISRNRAAVDDDRLKRDEDILGMVLQNRRVEV